MRRALVTWLAFAAALAACSVDVEGAKCTQVGLPANCPAGQACGTDLTCSVRAASCKPCKVGVRECRDGNVQVCGVGGDPACGSLTVTAGGSCAAILQTCKVPPAGGDPECACLNHVVDPAGGTCNYASITAAIAAAMRFDAPKVLLGGAAFTYGNAIDDAAPIVIPSGVTLIGDAASPAAATNRIIAVQGPGPEGLQVHPGATVQGVAVQRG